MPRSCSISAVTSPPMPPPTMIAFMTCSNPSPRLRGEAESRSDRVRGVAPLRPAPHPNPLPACGERGLLRRELALRLALGLELGARLRLRTQAQLFHVGAVAERVAEDLVLAGLVLG